ncbi:tricarballylate utilization 4Fe-4S protein TcuB [Pelagibius sp. 7325]|uniref:tricarballylate utilization 4Fe-4S protein TcuB n=1 Tax=Pelagibius sp. 7325 TaxID=3131994 RepID=UPI0030EF7A95
MLHKLLETESAAEADRILTICNACRYCEGHCAVFPAMTQRLSFTSAELGYFANLCHNCGSCYHHCQYADPHEFDVNVPRTMAALRVDTYEAAAWPGFLGRAFQNNGVWTALLTVLAVVVFMLAAAAFIDPATLFGSHGGNFYAVLSHNVMVTVFGAVSLFVLAAIVIGMARFWRLIGAPPVREIGLGEVGRALHDAMTLKYMGGGADLGCTYPEEAPSKLRRLFHHLTFYGFLLCFAATSVGTLYHYGFGWVAPYGYFSLPKLLGIFGGIGIVAGPLGLMVLKRRAAASPVSTGTTRQLDAGLLVLLLLTGLSGLVLTVLRDTELLGLFLVLHLGLVMGLFLAMPYGKFIHGFYRIQALVGFALEQRRGHRVIGAGDAAVQRQAAE